MASNKHSNINETFVELHFDIQKCDSLDFELDKINLEEVIDKMEILDAKIAN